MKSSLSIALLAATMFVAAPALHALSPLTLSGDGQALAAGNGNGNGGGNGNSGGNGGSRGNSADHAHGSNGKSSSGKSGAGNGSSTSGQKAGSSSAAGVPPKKSSKATVVASNAKPAAATAPKKNIHAELKGLNSLKRNINGMMNSADPRMAAIRAYITVEGNLQATTASLDKANQAVTDTKKTLDDLTAAKTLLENTNPPPADLQAQLDALDKQIADATTAYNDALAAQTAAQTAHDAAVTAATGVDDTTLTDAITAAQSPNTQLSDDAMSWAKDQVNRLVGDYAAAQI